MSNTHQNDSAASNNLVPVFMPPLAAMLARAESIKGSRLTETEVIQIRDEAPCVMMPPEMAEKMTENRGYRDVEPENCWADWYRLRVQMTGNGYLPKIVLCLLGDAELEEKSKPLLNSQGVEFEWQDSDSRMLSSFKASTCRYEPSFEESDYASIQKHSRVLYVLSKNFTAADAGIVSGEFLRLGCQLLEMGGLAMKCESSGIAHGRTRWMELGHESEDDDFWPALFRSYVQMPILDGDDYYSCGLQLLGLPDLIVSKTLLHEAHNSTKDQSWPAVNLFRAFALYLLSECSPNRFASGHTFSQDENAQRFRVLWEECTGYSEDDIFFNPYGRWRFVKYVR